MSDLELNQEELNNLLKDFSQTESSDKKVFQTKLLHTGILLITIKGRILGQDDSLKVINQFTSVLAGKDIRFIIDLSDCSYLSSMVLGALARLAENPIKKGKKMCAFGANEIIVDLFNLTQFTDFIELYDTLENAVKHFENM